MRWAVFIVFAGFGGAGAEVARDLVAIIGVPEGCKMESWRLRAAGSMSGMVGEGGMRCGTHDSVGLVLSAPHLKKMLMTDDSDVMHKRVNCAES